jgi:predicted SAM-dependent methyltransferase
MERTVSENKQPGDGRVEFSPIASKSQNVAGGLEKIHLGCSSKYLPGWKHADIKPFDHVDYVADIKEIDLLIENGTVDEIYACHCLEHFPRGEIDEVLQRWTKLLKPGGKMRLAVPSFEAVCKHYNANKDIAVLRGLVWGGQRDKYDYHFIGFDFEDIKRRLEVLGFSSIQTYDWRDFLPPDFDDYSRSYLPHLDFENGQLMSLNIVGTKN